MSRNAPPPSSLRARMTTGFTAWFTLVASVACVLFLLWSRDMARRDVQERVRAAAWLVAHEWENDAAARHAAKAISEAKEDMRLNNVALFIVDGSGRVLGTNRISALSLPEMRRHGWLVVEKPARNATIIAGMDWQATEAILHRQALLLFLFTLLVVGAGGVATWFLVGKTLRPIGVLAEEANSASADPLHARLRAPSDDAEVRHLVGTLNGFLERFQESTRAREQFYAAAAHELRTPLAVLSGSIELALSRPRAALEYAETLRDLQRETKRLIALAEGLLTLNRLQTLPHEEDPECVDITEQSQRILSTLRPLIRERGLRLSEEWATETAETFAPPSHVAMLLRNLIENAVKYAPAGGTVRVQTHREDGEIRVTAYNEYKNARSLPFDRIYDPFFRADPSRSAETGGNGLGLAICRRLADAHGWRLQHAPMEDGIVVDARFPVDQNDQNA
ncbi:MAG: hypothetical protein H7145_00720 [Akkermansiaceae bacterium]|nr:hypothetical protein [Armatimonadota bacterium]